MYVEFLVAWLRSWNGLFKTNGGDGMHNCLYKLSLAATLYHLWREINFRVFQNKKVDPGMVVQQIVSDLRCCMSAWKNVKRTLSNQRLCQEWHVSWNILC
ncbi:hypothetical protein RHGRI_031854 [Rhododendron griersonianum]|uniref:Uncharacterized protein n=2 Tax=Rhododendron griersonianum TaxID=479676 RepID=A0AAV6ID82_9ERIC|nr:hypothetical protein RHGRI_031854 [Rhododendron griersonianum]